MGNLIEKVQNLEKRLDISNPSDLTEEVKVEAFNNCNDIKSTVLVNTDEVKVEQRESPFEWNAAGGAEILYNVDAISRQFNLEGNEFQPLLDPSSQTQVN